ncbi:MAG: Fur family transcriptional regulator [Patescibacteria group bacterium]
MRISVANGSHVEIVKMRYHGGMKETATITADLKQAGLRATKQRVALLALLRGAPMPLGVEDLVRKGKNSFDTATAYRMLEAFVEGGLVRRLAFSRDRTLYEAQGTHHHHAICTSCATIVDVEACLPRTLDERVRSTAGFASITDHALEFFGLCKACSRKQS